ncbi:MAG TPA: glycosyltransferase family 4 protein [candidate division Zixibacteria bacterium]|nr:glycosyltransferase family 4 protein [candidate division Zixibacteria bacterium]
MNVLLVLPWDQLHGGVTSVAVNLARYLEKHGHEVFFFHSSRGAIFLKRSVTQLGFRSFELRLGLPFRSRRPVLSALAFPMLFPLMMLELCRLILQNKIEVVNIHYPTETMCFFALCRKLLPIKLVTSIHGADIFPKGRARERYEWPLKALLNASDLVVANSEAFRRDFLSLFPQFDKKTITIHNGVDIETFSRPCEEPAKNGRRYLLSVAMHNEKKGLDVLISAFAEIATHDAALELVLVGDGHLRPKLEALARSLKVQDRVKFLGRRGQSDVVRLLKGCEVFVHPAVAEPFGIAILEALACQKPVVASNTGGIPEIIRNGQNGVLVEPRNPKALAAAISTVLSDGALRDELAANGYATVRQFFRHTATGQRYESALRELIVGRRPGVVARVDG